LEFLGIGREWLVVATKASDATAGWYLGMRIDRGREEPSFAALERTNRVRRRLGHTALRLPTAARDPVGVDALRWGQSDSQSFKEPAQGGLALA
jgi:hypothetical protein